MTRRVFTFRPSTPAATPSTAPITTTLTIPEGEVTKIEVVIPDGHLGLTGIRLAFGGVQVIPETAGQWMQGNDEVIPIDTEGYPSSGAWQAITFNSDDSFTHDFLVRFFCDLAPPPTRAAPALLPANAIEPAQIVTVTVDAAAGDETPDRTSVDAEPDETFTPAMLGIWRYDPIRARLRPGLIRSAPPASRTTRPSR